MRRLERMIDLRADIVAKVISFEQVALCQRVEYVLSCEEQVCVFISCLFHLISRVYGLQGLRLQFILRQLIPLVLNKVDNIISFTGPRTDIIDRLLDTSSFRSSI